MRRLVPGQPRIVLQVYLPDVLARFASELGNHENAVRLHLLFWSDRQKWNPSGSGGHLHSGSQEILVHPIVRIGMRITIDLDPREGSDRSAGYDVARPVKLVVDARYSCQRSSTVEDRTDYPSRLRPPMTRLRRNDGGEGKRRSRVARWKRLIVRTLEASQEAEISRVRSVLIPVSYTHLRAHETDSYLVCRL